MSIIEPIDGDIVGGHHRFIGDARAEDILSGCFNAEVARFDGHNHKADEDDPLAEEVAWGLGSSTLPGTCHRRGKEGYDQRVHSLAALSREA